MSTPGVSIPNPNFVKIIGDKLTCSENNPEVFANLCHNLGVSSKLTFHDILSTTSPELLACIPRPVDALILLCGTPIYTATRSAVEPTIPVYQGSGPQEPVLWVKQTIGHACGLIALLHCVFNIDNGSYILPGSKLKLLRDELVPLDPAARADKLYNSTFLEQAHMHAAAQGLSHVPSPEDDCRHHFVALVRSENRQVWELNGCMNGPLWRGTLQQEEDLLSEEGLKATVQEFLDAARNLDGSRGNEINLVAVVGDGPEA